MLIYQSDLCSAMLDHLESNQQGNSEKGGGAGFGAEISSLHDFTPGVSWCILVILVYVLLSEFLDLKVLNVFILAVCFWVLWVLVLVHGSHQWYEVVGGSIFTPNIFNDFKGWFAQIRTSALNHLGSGNCLRHSRVHCVGRRWEVKNLLPEQVEVVGYFHRWAKDRRATSCSPQITSFHAVFVGWVAGPLLGFPIVFFLAEFRGWHCWNVGNTCFKQPKTYLWLYYSHI